MIKRIAGLLLAFAGMLLPPTSVGAQPPEREYEGAATEISGACPSLLFSVDGTTVATAAASGARGYSRAPTPRHRDCVLSMDNPERSQ